MMRCDLDSNHVISIFWSETIFNSLILNFEGKMRLGTGSDHTIIIIKHEHH